jgi:hypothetical protein
MDVPVMSLAGLAVPPFLVAAGLLLASGGAKLLRPDPAVRALGEARLPGGSRAIRMLGCLEAAIGGACLAVPGRIEAALLAVLYLGFAAFLVRLRQAGGADRSCGCVGGRDTPPSFMHVALDLLAAAAGLVAVLSVPPNVAEVVTRGPLLGIPTALGLVACAYAAYAAVVYVPSAWATYRPHETHDHQQPFRLLPFRSTRRVNA